MEAHLDVLDAQSLHDARWEHSAGESTPEDCIKLLVQTTNAQALKVESFGFEQLCGGEAFLPSDLDVGIVCHSSMRSIGIYAR